MAEPAILILAAGSSSRMRGADKLLERIDGEALIARQARIALATGCRVLVTLPPDRPARAQALAQSAVETLIVADAASGMAASLRAGAAALGMRPILILLADLPDITTADLLALLARHRAAPDRLLRATAEDGTPGHPVLLPVAVLPELAGLSGETGARDILHRHRTETDLVALPARHAVTDLDTPEDWAAWRALRTC